MQDGDIDGSTLDLHGMFGSALLRNCCVPEGCAVI